MERGGIETTIRPADLPQGRKFMLGIGIDNYPSAPLRNAVKDLYDMVDVLCNQYDFERENVKLLINEEGTRRNIINTLHSFTNSTRLGANDSLLVYFSGHGYLDNDNKEGYWVPIDSSPDDIASLIPNEIVQSRIAKMKCRHVLLISDSCFSGSLLAKERYAAPKNRLTDELERKDSRWIITSGRPDEKVLDATKTNGANSPFAAAMLSELRHNPSAKLLADDLALNVRKNTSSNARQIPQFEKLYGAGDMGGRFVFTLRNPEPGAWQLALSQNTTSAFESFIKDYPQSIHTGEAKERITALINQSAQTKELTSEEQREIFKRLPPPERANRLLDQRVQEWVNNNRTDRFMITPLEWLFIKRHASAIVDWGSNELTKKELLARSNRRWYSWIGAGILLLFIGLGFLAWRQSVQGQVWKMKWTLSQISKLAQQESSLLAIQALAATGEPSQALTAANQLSEDNKSYVLPYIALGFIENEDTLQARTLLTKALTAANRLPDNDMKVRVLLSIAKASIQIKDTLQVRKALIQALTGINRLPDYARAINLSSIALGFAQLKDTIQARKILTQALAVTKHHTDYSTSTDLSSIALSFAQLKDTLQARKILTQALTVTNQLPNDDKDFYLSNIALCFGQIKDTLQAKTILTQALTSSSQLSNTSKDEYKTSYLSSIALCFAQIKDHEGLTQALAIANRLPNHYKASLLPELALGFAQLNDTLHSKIALTLALEFVNDVYNLTYIAQAYAQNKDTLQARATLAQAVIVINQFPDHDKANPLIYIAKNFAQLNDWHATNHIINEVLTSNDHKAKALYNVLIIHYTRNNPKRQEELLKAAIAIY